MYQKFTHFFKEIQYFQLYNIGKVIKKVKWAQIENIK